MRKLPDKEEITEIALELGVDPSFVEKDWYAVQVLALISTIVEDTLTPVFSGGTSLSKGYGLIQRFSEDIDFKIKSDVMPARSKRRHFRQKVIDFIDAVEGLKVDNVVSHDGGSFFGLDITYPQTHGLDQSLRPNLKLEMKFQGVPLPTEKRDISSFVTQFKEGLPECSIECVSPIETATDKFSALIWRVRTKDRAQEQGSRDNDPTIIRHLHDLCALEKLARADKSFVRAVQQAHKDDQGRGGQVDIFLLDAAHEALESLKTDAEYEHEYAQFVDTACMREGQSPLETGLQCSP